MKRFGIILMGIILWTGLSAQTPKDTAVVKLNDSISADYSSATANQREAILLQKLNPDQLMQLEQQRLDNERKAQNEDLPLPPWAIVLITVSPFLMVILIIYFSVRARKEREKLRYDVYMKSLEAGQPLPEKFFETPEKKSSNLKRGAIWLAVGLGVVIFGLLDSETDLMGIGAIPALVGVAYLLVYFIEKKNNPDTPAVNE